MTVLFCKFLFQNMKFADKRGVCAIMFRSCSYIAPKNVFFSFFIFSISWLWLCGWLLLKANGANFQLFHYENKLHFDEMITMSAFHQTNKYQFYSLWFENNFCLLLQFVFIGLWKCSTVWFCFFNIIIIFISLMQTAINQSIYKSQEKNIYSTCQLLL